MRSVLITIAGSSNGRIVDSESIHLGSNPSPAAVISAVSWETREPILLCFLSTGSNSKSVTHLGIEP